MRHVITFLLVISILVLGTSHIFLWKDQAEMWHQFNLYLEMKKNWKKHEKNSNSLGI
jgi:uncharacterized protein YxeA